MKLEQAHIDQIRTAFEKMQSREDLLHLLNEAKQVVYGEKAFPFNLKQLTWYANPKLGRKRYAEFKIKKKSGAERCIHAPVKGLKSLQKTLSFVLQCVYEPHNAAMGFVRDKSIVDNAKIHVGSKYVYNIDLKDFFPSVDQARVWKCFQLKPFNLNKVSSTEPQYMKWEDFKKEHLKTDEPVTFLKGKGRMFTNTPYGTLYVANNFDKNKEKYILLGSSSLKTKAGKSLEGTLWLVNKVPDTSRLDIANIIASLCCTKMEVERKTATGEWEKVKRNVLPQGAPTSPVITNIVCQRLDYLLSAVAKRFGLKYSRYADDITFSSMHNVYQPESDFVKELHRIITEQGFHIKESKTRLQKDGYRKEVTGLLVNEKANVQQRYIKQLRMWLYYWEAYGYERASGFFLQQYLIEKGHVVKGKPDMGNVIAGKLDYLKMVKGEENELYLTLKGRYNRLTNKKDLITEILEYWVQNGIEVAMNVYEQKQSRKMKNIGQFIAELLENKHVNINEREKLLKLTAVEYSKGSEEIKELWNAIDKISLNKIKVKSSCHLAAIKDIEFNTEPEAFLDELYNIQYGIENRTTLLDLGYLNTKKTIADPDKTPGKLDEKGTKVLTSEKTESLENGISFIPMAPIHNPIKTVELLKFFTSNDKDLKYSTHSWEEGKYEGYDDYIGKIKTEWESTYDSNTEGKYNEILRSQSERLHAKVSSFLFNKKLGHKNEKGYYNVWGEKRLKFGWSSPELKIHMSEQGNSPFSCPIPNHTRELDKKHNFIYFKEYADVFKNEIEFREDSNNFKKMILELWESELSYDFNIQGVSDLIGFSFFTDVDYVKGSIRILFSDLFKTKPEFNQIIIEKVSNFENGGYHLIKITQRDSFVTRDINDPKFTNPTGNLHSIIKNLKNLADYSIVSKFADGKNYRINYLSSTENKFIQELEIGQEVYGFTHEFKFYL